MAGTLSQATGLPLSAPLSESSAHRDSAMPTLPLSHTQSGGQLKIAYKVPSIILLQFMFSVHEADINKVHCP